MSADRRRLGGHAVQKISFSWLYNFFQGVEPLSSLPSDGSQAENLEEVLRAAAFSLAAMHTNNSLYSPYLRASTGSSNKLFTEVLKILQPNEDNNETNRNDLLPIKTAFQEYRAALMAEIESMNLYLVTPKWPYDTHSLLENGELIFPRELAIKVPQALYDAKEAAKCLAFEMPNACGFHVMRALEAVVISYYEFITGCTLKINQRNLGAYFRGLTESGKADGKVLLALGQIKDLHRNPLMHPEAQLALDEVISLIGIAQSVIRTMIAVLPVAVTASVGEATAESEPSHGP